MKTIFLLAALTALTSATIRHDHNTTILSPTVNTTYTHFDCGVTQRTHATAHFNATIAALHASTGARTPSHLAALSARTATTITVPVYFHIITSTASAGTISSTMATAQLAALNARYNPHSISFVLQGTTTTVNDAWAIGAGTDDLAMKKALRKGSYGTLNIYFQTDLTGGILGVCTLPTSIGAGTPSPSTYVSDGCNVQANTMPGGDVYDYNSGMTAVHETGHWLGLLHTFEGYECTGPGDYIADTKIESVSTSGCPTGKNSCPGVAGTDPVHNYMDYSTDACYERFTPGQVARIVDLWAEYRKGR